MRPTGHSLDRFCRRVPSRVLRPVCRRRSVYLQVAPDRPIYLTRPCSLSPPPSSTLVSLGLLSASSCALISLHPSLHQDPKSFVRTLQIAFRPVINPLTFLAFVFSVRWPDSSIMAFSADPFSRPSAHRSHLRRQSSRFPFEFFSRGCPCLSGIGNNFCFPDFYKNSFSNTFSKHLSRTASPDMIGFLFLCLSKHQTLAGVRSRFLRKSNPGFLFFLFRVCEGFVFVSRRHPFCSIRFVPSALLPFPSVS